MQKTEIVRWVGQFGGYSFARQLTLRVPRVLMYHRFTDLQANASGGLTARQFKDQLRYLRRHFTVISLEQLVHHHRHEIPLPARAVVLTIDDGYADFYRVALPVLEKFGMPATLYATTEFISQRIWMWPDKISFLLKVTRGQQLPVDFTTESHSIHQTFDLQTRDERSHAAATLIEFAKQLPQQTKETFIQQLAEQLDTELPVTPPKDYAAMTWDQLRELPARGVTVGAHTRHHPILSQVPETDLEDEILGSKQHLEAELDQPVDHFCYPNGTPADYTPAVINTVKQAGFMSATAAYFAADVMDDLYTIKRHGVDDDMFQFQKATSGFEYLSHRLRGIRHRVA